VSGKALRITAISIATCTTPEPTTKVSGKALAADKHFFGLLDAIQRDLLARMLLKKRIIERNVFWKKSLPQPLSWV
jgi:hypothetical protein